MFTISIHSLSPSLLIFSPAQCGDLWIFKAHMALSNSSKVIEPGVSKARLKTISLMKNPTEIRVEDGAIKYVTSFHRYEHYCSYKKTFLSLCFPGSKHQSSGWTNMTAMGGYMELNQPSKWLAWEIKQKIKSFHFNDATQSNIELELPSPVISGTLILMYI